MGHWLRDENQAWCSDAFGGSWVSWVQIGEQPREVDSQDVLPAKYQHDVHCCRVTIFESGGGRGDRWSQHIPTYVFWRVYVETCYNISNISTQFTQLAFFLGQSVFSSQVTCGNSLGSCDSLRCNQLMVCHMKWRCTCNGAHLYNWCLDISFPSATWGRTRRGGRGSRSRLWHS